MCDWLQETCLGFILSLGCVSTWPVRWVASAPGLCTVQLCRLAARFWYQNRWGWVEFRLPCHWLGFSVPLSVVSPCSVLGGDALPVFLGGASLRDTVMHHSACASISCLVMQLAGWPVHAQPM